ncbi:CCD69 protein, partial [Spizaetus tyrannus]|nr:CCD69 protein [Spizaetus tyrannus]
LCQRQLKAQQQREPASQELTALKTENANATLLPEDGKEKAALREERTESTRLLQGQEEEETHTHTPPPAGTARITQDINNQVDLEEQFDALRREHTETLQELQRAHEQEKVHTHTPPPRSQAALQETIQVLNSQLKSFQERMKRVEESLLSTDYKKHTHTHTPPPGRGLASGLESLHFVIEMKNTHTHTPPPKLLNLETVVERNTHTHPPPKTLQQENEDLQVRHTHTPPPPRQLSEELLAATHTHTPPPQLREQARREKEEHTHTHPPPGDGTPFPIAASEVPLIAT